MEKTKRQKVRYEFYTFSGQVGVIVTQINLKLENPASIKFVYEGLAGSFAQINNIYFLSPLIDTNTGVAPYPSTLVLENNQDEIDVTNYSLKIGQGQVVIICKYFINE